MNAPLTYLPLAARSSRPLAPSLERWRLRVYLGLLIGDTVCLGLSFFLAGGLYLGQWPAPIAMLEAQLLLPVYLTIALYQAAYSFRALSEWRFAVGRSWLALIVATALLIFITFYTKSTTEISRGTFSLALLFCGLSFAALRFGAIKWIRSTMGPSVMNVLLIEDGGPKVELQNAFRIDAVEHDIVPDPSDPYRLDRIGRYFLNMERVVVSCPMERRQDWTFVLRAAGIRGEVVSGSLQELRPMGLEVDGDCISLVVSSGPLGMRARIAKRLFDLAFATAGLIAISPVLLLAALAIKLDDGGPVFFIQRRLGRGNRFFQMFKFRSMRVEKSDADGNRSASRDDDRCTKVGRFLRRTSIDELPQLLNVLRGDMSVVGPRPHALGSQAGDKLFWEVDGRYWHRHSLKPGLTGLAQVRGYRGATERESDLQHRLHADLEYISSWSLWRDIGIVLKTLRVLVHQKAF